MKKKKWALVFLLFTGIILFATQSAIGGCEVGDLDWLISEGNAPGTKLDGPITIFYQPKEDNGPEEENAVTCFEGAEPADMYFFLRLKKGANLYSFAGGPEIICFPDDVTEVVPYIIGVFFDEHVVPTLYPDCTPNQNPPDEDCPNIVLKSADLGVDWEPPPGFGFTSGLNYFIANIQVGIHD
jgi:hypothetical protein